MLTFSTVHDSRVIGDKRIECLFKRRVNQTTVAGFYNYSRKTVKFVTYLEQLHCLAIYIPVTL
jgi:CobQ-like glutamine amidotransferase family enzyme